MTTPAATVRADTIGRRLTAYTALYSDWDDNPAELLVLTRDSDGLHGFRVGRHRLLRQPGTHLGRQLMLWLSARYGGDDVIALAVVFATHIGPRAKHDALDAVNGTAPTSSDPADEHVARMYGVDPAGAVWSATRYRHLPEYGTAATHHAPAHPDRPTDRLITVLHTALTHHHDNRNR